MKIAKFQEVRHALGMIFSQRTQPSHEDLFVYLGDDLVYASYEEGQTQVLRFGARHQDALERGLRRLMGEGLQPA